MTVTPDQGRMIATLACDSRPTGARRWKPEKVLAEIQKLHDRALPAVICAVTRCAMDRNIEREEAISSAGSHWSDTQIVVPMTARLAPNERCSVCSKSEPACRINHGGRCDSCGDGTCNHHVFLSAADAKRAAEGAPEEIQGVIAALKDEIAATPKRDPAPHGLEGVADRNPRLKAKVDKVRAVLPPVAPMRESEPEVEMEAAE